MSFRLVPKSVTLNGLERRIGVILRCFSEFGYLPGALRKSSRSLSHLLMSSCYTMKLCSRLFVLYCRNCSKDDKFRYFIPHFEKVRGGVEPWLMARWKARVEFLLSVIELLFVSPTVEALQDKMCQNSQLSGGVGQFEPRFQGKWVVPGEYFLVSTKLDTFCYPTVQSVQCYVPSF